jgi:hypothetical protein
MWAKDVVSWESARAKGTEASPGLLLTYGSTHEDPDTLHVYGGWDEAMKRADPSVDLCFHKSMAGYMKQDGAGEPGPPLIGFTRRHVLPGRADALAASFEAVCDYWHKRVPGILAAEVSQDGSETNMVHDIRIFANHAAFQAHADKTDPAFVAVMTAWFANYDTSVPFTGELYLHDTAAEDEGIRTSSIKDRPVRTGFSEFIYGEGMLGPMPDMCKDD